MRNDGLDVSELQELKNFEEKNILSKQLLEEPTLCNNQPINGI